MAPILSSDMPRLRNATHGRATPMLTNDHYDLIAVPPDIVRVTITGFWNRAVMTDFIRDITKVVLTLPCRPEEHRALCDLSPASIQTRDIFAGFCELLTNTMAPARQVAFFTGNPASRMQARRLIATRPDVRLFDSETAALDWLAGQEVGNV